jgi:hypothetical protein
MKDPTAKDQRPKEAQGPAIKNAPSRFDEVQFDVWSFSGGWNLEPGASL